MLEKNHKSVIIISKQHLMINGYFYILFSKVFNENLNAFKQFTKVLKKKKEKNVRFKVYDRRVQDYFWLCKRPNPAYKNIGYYFESLTLKLNFQILLFTNFKFPYVIWFLGYFFNCLWNDLIVVIISKLRLSFIMFQKHLIC